MQDKYLIVNAGSSSLKFTLYSMNEDTYTKQIVKGLVEKIGESDSFYSLKFNGKIIENKKEIKNHTQAVGVMLKELIENKFIQDINEIKAVGHRVLHGGEIYSDSVIIDDKVLSDIKILTKLGPLHHPGEIAGIESIQKFLPNAVQVAVFDTAFHQTIKEENFIYPVPYSWYKENGVRKYGFHGTSHKYITEVVQKLLNKENVNIISCHMGNGDSLCAIKNSESFNTTMGLTPLAGVMMGTRSGDVDPSIIEYMCKEKNLSVFDITNQLNNESGLKGICGKSDMRDVIELANSEDYNAKLALKLFEKSIASSILEYYFELEGNIDVIVFTAGIGENISFIRENIINSLSKVIDIKLNKEENDNIAKFKKNQCGVITSNDSKIKAMVIPTNEEYMILKDTYELSKVKKKVR